MIKTKTNNMNALTLILLFAWSALQSVFAAEIPVQIRPVESNSILQSLTIDYNISDIRTGDTLTFSLLDGPGISFVVTSNLSSSNGGATIIGQSGSGEQLLINSDKRAVYGSLSGNGLRYSITEDPQFGTVLVNQNHADFPIMDFGDDGLVPPNLNSKASGLSQMSVAAKSQLEQRMASTSGPSTIRMLIVYSAEYGQGFASPVTRINQLLTFTNQALQSSNIDIIFTLAGAEQINFDNNLTTTQTLNQITNGTGDFSGVAALRNEVGADMVAVLSFTNAISANGLAWVNGDNPNFAFSAMRMSPLCCDSVFAHELGHNLGSGHERASVNNVSDPCSGFNFTGYSCGHGNTSNGGWGTMMSRLDRNIVNHVFSNPSIDCLGEPCGIPNGQAEAADNFASFNITRLLIENFRADPVIQPPTPTPNPNPNPGNGNTDAIPAVISILLDDA